MNNNPIYRSSLGEEAVASFYAAVPDKGSAVYERIFVPTRQGRTFVLACCDESAPAP